MKQIILFTLAVMLSTPTAFAETVRQTGKVKSFDPSVGVGRIVGDEGSEEIYFGDRDVSWKFRDSIRKGDCVSYYLTQSNNTGLRTAVAVDVIDCQ